MDWSPVRESVHDQIARLTPHRWSAAFNNLGFRDREAALRTRLDGPTAHSRKKSPYFSTVSSFLAAADPSVNHSLTTIQIELVTEN